MAKPVNRLYKINKLTFILFFILLILSVFAAIFQNSLLDLYSLYKI